LALRVHARRRQRGAEGAHRPPAARLRFAQGPRHDRRLDLETSVFPSSSGSYLLPVKKPVRRAEGLEAGDVVTVELELIG
jgi:hypothetical protein